MPSREQIPQATLTKIDRFVGIFEHVTTRFPRQQAVTAAAPRSPGTNALRSASLVHGTSIFLRIDLRIFYTPKSNDDSGREGQLIDQAPG